MEQIIKAEEFDLNPEKAMQIQEAFAPMITEREAYTEQYNSILNAEITPELSAQAKVLRLPRQSSCVLLYVPSSRSRVRRNRTGHLLHR